MPDRDHVITRLSQRAASQSSVVSTLVTAVAIVAVFVVLGVVAKLVYDALPASVQFVGLLVTLGLLGFGGLYAATQLNDLLQ